MEEERRGRYIRNPKWIHWDVIPRPSHFPHYLCFRFGIENINILARSTFVLASSFLSVKLFSNFINKKAPRLAI